MFLSMYTGKIEFAALGSQCAAPSEEAQAGYSQDKGSPSQGPEGLGTSPSDALMVGPCSPKSIYCLAEKVCLTPLRSGTATNNSFI